MSAELERLAAATLFPGFPETAPPDWIRRLAERGVGGVVLFARNVERLPELTAELHAERGDLLVALDEEGGDVTRLEARTGSSYPGNGALGAVDDLELTRAVAAAIGADLRAAGVDLDLAPVADVNSDPQNPVIGVRSFGSDPERVAAHVVAFVAGLQSQGVAACVKHFPGHGATRQDSHVELPTVSGDPEAGLPPFRAAFEAGVQSAMTAHVLVPTLDDVPATLSAPILGLIRTLGFDGMVMTDALEMGAILDIEDGAVRALLAGADALCLGHDVDEETTERVLQAIAAAVPEARLREAAERVRRVSEWVAAQPPGASVDRGIGLAAARRALHVEGDVTLAGRPTVVELAAPANIAAGPAAHSLASILGTTGDGPLVIVVRDAHRHPWMQAEADVDGAIVVELGVPVWRPTRARGYVATHGGSRVSFEAVAELLGAEVPA
jgi:beta-N-acetylhexosaminidase